MSVFLDFCRQRIRDGNDAIGTESVSSIENEVFAHRIINH